MAKEKDEPTEEKSGGKLKGILILGIGLVVLVAGAFAFVQFAVPKAAEETAAAEIETDPSEEWNEETLRLPELFVNLAGTAGKRYLKIGLSVKFRSEDPTKVKTALETDDTLVKDRMITLLSGKTLEDIDGAENKRLLKKEILETLEETLFVGIEQAPGIIDQVYYYEFLVQ